MGDRSHIMSTRGLEMLMREKRYVNFVTEMGGGLKSTKYC